MKVVLSDAIANVWLDNVDEIFLKKVMVSLAAMLRRKGWSIWVPYDEHKENRHGKSFDRRWAERYRKGIKNGLEIELYIFGCHLECKMWENINDHSADNSNGGKYIFNKESKMPYLLKVLTNLTKKQIYNHLEKHYEAVPDKVFKVCEFKRKKALDYVLESIKDCSHYKPELGHAEIYGDNDNSKDGLKIKHGMPVYFTDWKGRILKGVAYYKLNSIWYVVTGKWDYSVASCHEIFVNMPESLKTKRNQHIARKRLEHELAQAVKKMDFDRAKTIKNILFGDQVLYHVIKDGMYYRPNGSGYTNNTIDAGKYTEKEVEYYRTQKALEVVPVYQG